MELTGRVAGSIVTGDLDAYRFGTTIGIRSAGALDGVVLFAGPTMPGTVVAGLGRSLVIPSGGLTADHANSWEKVFEFSDYEPDPVTAMTYGGGALVSWGDHLYWGTMHVPLMAMGAHAQANGEPEGALAGLDPFMGTHRAIAIFRASEFGGHNRTELLYGHQQLPVYQDGQWRLEPNRLGPRPRFGTSGFGNPYNNYTWTMGVRRDRLYVGTMDWSYLLDQGLSGYIAGTDIPPEVRYLFTQGDHGADLWRFDKAKSPARAESISGVGNPTNYGIRTMVVQDDDLFLGSANPMYLLVGGDDEGGWELLGLKPSASKPGGRPRR